MERVSEPKRFLDCMFVKERVRVAAVHLIELGARPLYSSIAHLPRTLGCSTTQVAYVLFTTTNKGRNKNKVQTRKGKKVRQVPV